MNLSLQALIARAETFVVERETLRAKLDPAPSSSVEHSGLLDRFPELALEESFAIANGAGNLPLTRFLARFAEAWDARRISAELGARLQSSKISVAAQRFGFAEARRRVRHEPERLLRSGLEHGLEQLYWELRAFHAERVERAVGTARRLGFQSYADFRAGTGTRPAEPEGWPAAIERFLQRTDDAYRDLLAYVLKKIGVELSSAGHHDAVVAIAAPWLDTHFRREEVVPAWTRWLDSSGLGFRADGRLDPELNLEVLEGHAPRAIALEAPGRIQLLAPPARGLEGYTALLEATGRAQYWAQLDPKRSAVERRLPPPTALESSALLFGGLLTEGLWLRRILGFAPHVANDAVKLAVLYGLWRVRRDCALWKHQATVYQDGGGEAAHAESYITQMHHGLAVSVPRGFFLRDAEERHETSTRLVATATAAELHRELRTRFDEDYWKNPSAGVWLQDHWRRGAENSDILTAADLTKAGDAWIELLNR